MPKIQYSTRDLHWLMVVVALTINFVVQSFAHRSVKSSMRKAHNAQVKGIIAGNSNLSGECYRLQQENRMLSQEIADFTRPGTTIIYRNEKGEIESQFTYTRLISIGGQEVKHDGTETIHYIPHSLHTKGERQ